MSLTHASLAIPLVLLGSACSSSPGATIDARAAVDSTVTIDGAATCPGSACLVADPTCLASHSTAGATKFLLSMMQVSFSAPVAFTSGLIAQTFTSAIDPNVPTCGLHGNGLAPWLLQFDSVAQQVTTGSGTANPAGAYSFSDETSGNFHVQPVTLNTTIGAGGAFSTPTGGDLVISINLSPTMNFPVPLHQVLVTGALSSNDDCIGSYNSASLEPANSCAPQGNATAFSNGGQFKGFITLAEADAVIIAAINESLCAALSGNAAMYGAPNGTGQTVCKVDSNNNIVFRGDWCAATNAAATNTCADAVEFVMNFAAAGVPAAQ